MKLWGKSRKRQGVEYATAAHTLEDPGFWVGWVSYCQDELEAVAQQIGWTPGVNPSPPLVAQVIPDPKTPRDPDGYRVEIGGLRVGYAPRGRHGQQAGQTAVVLVKNGRDIIAWAAA